MLDRHSAYFARCMPVCLIVVVSCTSPSTLPGLSDSTPDLSVADADSGIEVSVHPDAGLETTRPPTCGDGIVEPPELCDEGALNGQYGRCATSCDTMGPHCGDSITQPDYEVCDDGAGNNGGYGNCAIDCRSLGTRCGDGIITPDGEVCDDGADFNGLYGFCAGDCQGYASRCGDGVVDGGWETCDDGPLNGTPGNCPASCNETPDCGDQVVVEPEVCDDGGLNGTYGACAADCSGPGAMCGDGVVDVPHEACDHGESNGSYGFCQSDCSGLGSHCGDGVVDNAMETCDDGLDNGVQGACAVDCSGVGSPWMEAPGSITVPPTDGLACDDNDLLAKYFRYRRRFRGDGTAAFPGFVSLGTEEGQSLPASRRQPDVDCSKYWSFETCPIEDIQDAKGMYNWGDGTIWQGDYLAALALEHALFSSLGIATGETEADLALALKTVDRLDLRAESFYPGVAPTLDGFFVRDDAPASLYLNADGSYRFPRADGYAGYECIRGDLLCDAPTIDGGAFTSQDQTISLVYGLGMVSRLVPESALVDGEGIPSKARATVHRLVMHLRDHGWKVVDPDGVSPPDVWGGNAIGFSDQLAKAANGISGDGFGIDDYRNLASRTLGASAWGGLQLIWDSTLSFNRTMGLRMAATNMEWSPSKMAEMALRDGKDFFALAYAVAAGVELGAPFSSWRVEALLRTAPCSGPCRATAGCADVGGWQGESRNINAGDRIGSQHWDTAEFNGLDYMMLFAAWHLYEKGYWQLGPAAKPPLECGGVTSFEQVLAQTLPAGSTFDPADPCNAQSLKTLYCNRPLGTWLDDAARGEVNMFTGPYRWECEPGGICAIANATAGYTSLDDLIIGSNGDDELEGGNGNDCIVGLGGNDVLEGGQGYDWLEGRDGNDILYGESGGIVLAGDGDVLHGGPGDDELHGNPGRDELYGGPGKDTLDGGNGDDFIMGGAESDVLKGGLGDDHLDGGTGDDELVGDDGDDVMWGGDGRDKLDGEAGADHLAGGTGPDFLRGGSGNDRLFSGDVQGDVPNLSVDRLCGNGGDDILWGGWDNDECLGGGWFLGGTDQVAGCEDGNISSGDCDNAAFNAW